MTCFYGDLWGDLQIRDSFLWNRLEDATQYNIFKRSFLHHHCSTPALQQCLLANSSAGVNLQGLHWSQWSSVEFIGPRV